MKIFFTSIRPALPSTLTTAAILCFLAPLATFAAEKEAEIIASFEEPDSMQNWKSYNDGIMGGRSRGGSDSTGQKTILFTGDISLENGGGFASIRSKPNPTKPNG